MARWTEKLTQAGVQKAAIALYVVCLVALIVAFVSVSLMKVERAAYIQGPSALEKGRPNAMRGVLLDAPSGRFLTDTDVDLSLIAGAHRAPMSPEELAKSSTIAIATGRTAASGHVHMRARVPTDTKPGGYTLLLRAEGAQAKGFQTTRSVRVVERSVPADYWPERTERLPQGSDAKDAKTLEKSQGPVRIDILPDDGRISRGVASEVYLRASDRHTGEPVSVRVDFDKAEGMGTGKLPASVHTDKLGLVRVPVEAMGDQTWTLSTHTATNASKGAADPSEPTSSVTVHLTTVPTQVSVQMNDVLAVAGEPLDGVVHSLFRSGGVMVDLYNADDWVDAAAYGIRPDQSGIRVRVPRLDKRAPLYRVQVYRSLYNPGGAWDIEYLVASDGRSLDDYQKAATTLSALLAKHTDDAYFDWLARSDVFATAGRDELRRWIGAMLRAVPRHLDRPSALINSQKADRDRLDAWKAGVKSDLMLLTAVALLIGMAVVVYLVILGVRSYRKQNQLLRDVEFEMSMDEADAEASSELDKTIGQANLVAGLQIFIVMATLVFFMLGLLLLFSHL